MIAHAMDTSKLDVDWVGDFMAGFVELCDKTGVTVILEGVEVQAGMDKHLFIVPPFVLGLN